MNGMAASLFNALWQAALPVGLASFALVWWVLDHEQFNGVSSLKELEGRVKKISADKKKAKKAQKASKANTSNNTASNSGNVSGPAPAPVRPLNRVHNKWLSFGGGFYGVVALLTYALIELDEIGDFFANYNGLWHLIETISVQQLVALLVASIMNFVTAITWPVYWMNHIRGEHMWMWFVAAYGGYWLGCKLALRRHARRALAVGE